MGTAKSLLDVPDLSSCGVYVYLSFYPSRSLYYVSRLLDYSSLSHVEPLPHNHSMEDEQVFQLGKVLSAGQLINSGTVVYLLFMQSLVSASTF